MDNFAEKRLNPFSKEKKYALIDKKLIFALNRKDSNSLLVNFKIM